MSNDFFKTPDIPVRYVFRMHEVSTDALKYAIEKRERSHKQVSLLHEAASGVFDYSLIFSDNKVYEVIRLGNFASCTCKDFEYSHTACKHIAAAWPRTCIECFETPVETLGQTCKKCIRTAEREEVDTAAFFRPQASAKATIIGNIRV